jgi:hypothetical protein
VFGKEGVDRAMEGVVVGKGVGEIFVEVAVVAAGATKSLWRIPTPLVLIYMTHFIRL